MSKKALFSKYLKELSAVTLRGDAREESFYPALADMLAEVAQTSGRTHVCVTTLPKPTDAGNPDFRLWNGTDRIVGYVEAKKSTEERLDVTTGQTLPPYHRLGLTPRDVKWRRRAQR